MIPHGNSLMNPPPLNPNKSMSAGAEAISAVANVYDFTNITFA
jgi:hypothetical protein